VDYTRTADHEVGGAQRMDATEAAADRSQFQQARSNLG